MIPVFQSSTTCRPTVFSDIINFNHENVWTPVQLSKSTRTLFNHSFCRLITNLMDQGIKQTCKFRLDTVEYWLIDWFCMKTPRFTRCLRLIREDLCTLLSYLGAIAAVLYTYVLLSKLDWCKGGTMLCSLKTIKCKKHFQAIYILHLLYLFMLILRLFFPF